MTNGDPMSWQPMATRGRGTPFTFRDFALSAAVVVAIIVVAYLVGRFVP
jgi:hypothetical protein